MTEQAGTELAVEVYCCRCEHRAYRNGSDWRCERGCQCTMRGCALDPESRKAVEAKRCSRVNSATITPRCRTSQGDQGAWDAAVDRLGMEYSAICRGWAHKPEQPTLRLVLEMERP